MRIRHVAIAGTLLCVGIARAQAACDPEVVKSERASMQGFGTWRDGKQGADFRWAPLFDGIAPGARAAMMKHFGQWFHCVNGKSRQVDFYLHDKLIARTLADGRYVPVDDSFDDGPQIRIWIRTGAK